MALSQYHAKVLARRIIRAGLNPLLAKWFARRDYDLRDTLVVAGESRTGTTWLAELVSTIPGAAVLFEPLDIRKVPEAAAAGFNWHTCVAPNDSWPEGEAFFAKVLQGKLINRHTMSHVSLRRTICPKLWVVKLLNANLLLGWLTTRFPIRAPALIIRHPCATVLSRSEQGWTPLKQPPRISKFLAAHPEFTEVLDRLTDIVEFRAALWCIEYYAPLSLPQPYPFHLVTYEGLVRDGQRELSRLFDRWGIDLPAEARERLELPSQTTKRRAEVYRSQDPLAKWRKVLSKGQIAKILRVVEGFGLDFYGNDLEPDYDRLHGSSPVGALP